MLVVLMMVMFLVIILMIFGLARFKICERIGAATGQTARYGRQKWFQFWRFQFCCVTVAHLAILWTIDPGLKQAAGGTKYWYWYSCSCCCRRFDPALGGVFLEGYFSGTFAEFAFHQIALVFEEVLVSIGRLAVGTAN